MAIALTHVLIWIVLAAIIGVVGKLLARRHTRGGIIGAMLVGVLALVLVVGCPSYFTIHRQKRQSRAHPALILLKGAGDKPFHLLDLTESLL